MELSFRLPVFEGPLDLLLHLIQEAKVSIEEIPIALITDQYLLYLETMDQLQMDITSEFIVMASQLLALKSRTLLPKLPVYTEEEAYEEWEDDPEEQLIQQLLEYQRIKTAATLLEQKMMERAKLFSREPEDLRQFIRDVPYNPLSGITVFDLVHKFHQVLKRSTWQEPEVQVERDEITLEDRLIWIQDLLQLHGKLWFSDLLTRLRSKRDLVITFLSLLELTKSGKVRCLQYELFADILLEHIRTE